MSLSCAKIRVEELENGEGASQMAKNVRAGLLSTPKDLSPWPKYFYDERGSKLFEEITALPEYYQSRTELSILEEKAPEIVARTRCQELVELGSGYKVLRGGSWATRPGAIRNTFRNWDFPIRRQLFVGFRCAKDA